MSQERRTVIGFHSVKEALKVRPRAIKKATFRKNWEDSQELKQLMGEFKGHRIPVDFTSPQQLDKLGSQHQGIAVDINETPEIDWSHINAKKSQVLIALDGIEDPHNFGAMIRTAWLLGADAIFSLKNRAVGLTPTVHKIATGGVEHVPIEFHANLQSTIEWLKDQGFAVFGLSEKSSTSLFKAKMPSKILWIVGSEDKGIRKSYLDLCDQLVSIPQTESHHSLNASIALAISLAETKRQLGPG